MPCCRPILLLLIEALEENADMNDERRAVAGEAREAHKLAMLEGLCLSGG